MQPEISHRCSACGFSIRDEGKNILFCPECGEPLAAEAKAAKAKKDEARGPQPETPVSVLPTGTSEKAEPSNNSPASEKVSARAEDERLSARERTRETLQRASQRTRGAIEDNVKRVEKIHHVSSAVIE